MTLKNRLEEETFFEERKESFVFCFKLQGAGAADVGRHHGHVDIQRPGLRRGEGRGGDDVHLDAPGSLLGDHYYDLGGLRGHRPHHVVWKTCRIRSRLASIFTIHFRI